jgi:hypothetical protein
MKRTMNGVILAAGAVSGAVPFAEAQSRYGEIGWADTEDIKIHWIGHVSEYDRANDAAAKAAEGLAWLVRDKGPFYSRGYIDLELMRTLVFFAVLRHAAKIGEMFIFTLTHPRTGEYVCGSMVYWEDESNIWIYPSFPD